MISGLIGFTGFVGGNLHHQKKFDQLYNSKNIQSIIEQKFDLLVCAGAPAVKWLANKEPLKDKENLQKLINCLAKVSTQKLVLISTVDVYPNPLNVDEDSPINREILQPYGKHRLELEDYITANFNTLVIRLPGLFGQGLKKNIIYDFLNNNIGDWINKDSVFQFYDLAHLWDDIQTAIKHDLPLVNFATEPLSVAEVAREAFGFEFTNPSLQQPAQYNMKSKYSQLFNSSQAGYLYSRKQVLRDLHEFIRQQNLKNNS